MARNRTRSMSQQLTHAVRQSFKEGTSKRYEIKGGHGHDKGKSYSYQTMENRLDLSKQFAKFLEAEGVKKATSITSKNVNDFLLMKKEEGISQATLTRYSSDLRALGKEIKETYGKTNIITKEVITPKTQAKQVRTPEGIKSDDLMKIINHTTNPNLKNGLVLSITFGLRAEGCVTCLGSNVYRGADGSVYCDIVEKGGRARTIKALMPGMGEYALKLASKTPSNAPIVPLQAKSLSRALNRELTRYKIKYQGHNGAMHMVRKTYAQTLYNQCRESGMNKHETIGYVNEQLGHSAERDSDLLARYVADMW